MPLSLQLGCGLSANRGASSGGGGSDSVTFGALTLAEQHCAVRSRMFFGLLDEYSQIAGTQSREEGVL